MEPSNPVDPCETCQWWRWCSRNGCVAYTEESARALSREEQKAMQRALRRSVKIVAKGRQEK